MTGENSRFKKIDSADLAAFRGILSEAFVLTDEPNLRLNGSDETEDFCFPPEAVLLPATTEEVSKIMAYCNSKRIAVTVRGAGSGLAGGCLPVIGGVVLGMKRFDKILFLDEKNLQVTVEPGVITENLQNAVAEKGLYYPPDPASRGWSFIGGNVATGAGGPRALKYGVVKDYVLNLEVVLASGEVIWTGSNTLKNSTGYNLTQLLVGSEGTLGVVTQIVLKLVPLPKFNLLMLAPFRSAENACSAVAAIFQAGIVPSALEFMERAAILKAVEYVGDVPFSVGDEVEAHLLIEVDGQHLDFLMLECEQIASVLERFEVMEVLFADTESQKTDLWRLRRNVGHATKLGTIYKEEDTVVPRADLPLLLRKVHETGRKYGFESISYGHAGDGNLHVNILKGQLSDADWAEKVPLGIREIFEFVKSRGGTVSGEHGIGWVQRRYLDIVFSETEMAIGRAIKKAFDPNGILNPEKIFD